VEPCACALGSGLCVHPDGPHRSRRRCTDPTVTPRRRSQW
jgi:hypothetical protein